MNLDATSAEVGPFDQADADRTSNNREVVTIFDSLGTARQASIFFTKTSPNNWDFNIALAEEDANPASNPGGDPFVVQGSGSLVFDTDGALQTFTIAGGGPISFDLNNANGAAQTQTVDFSMGPVTGGATTGIASTQFNQPPVTNFVSQDGFSPGTLSALDFDEDGKLNGVLYEWCDDFAGTDCVGEFRERRGLE